MNNSTTMHRATDIAETTVSAELTKVSATAFGLSAAAVACWATVALLSATLNSGGPLNLLSALATTITG